MLVKANTYNRMYPYLNKMNPVKKCTSFLYFAKCANFRKMNISEGYFIQ